MYVNKDFPKETVAIPKLLWEEVKKLSKESML